MSTLKTGIVQNNTGTGAPVFKNNSGTEIGQLCKAWVNFNGAGVVAIRDSFNVSSLADDGTGIYTITFTNAQPTVNYAAVYGANAGIAGYAGSYTQNTSTLKIFGSSSGSFNDLNTCNVVVFGD